MKQIALINASTVVSDAQALAWVGACQIQLSRDFTPVWYIDVKLNILTKGASLPTDKSWMVILDDADQAGELGYHDVTSSGLPMGKVFAKTSKLYGIPGSLPLSHELLELVPDPDVNLLVRLGHNSFAYETCDPVESPESSYTINGIMVSNFVWPCYFQTFLKNRQMDQRGLLSGPLPAMLPGGYLLYQTSSGTWRQIYGDSNLDASFLFKARPHPGSRRMRRILGSEQWIISTAEHA